VQQARPLWRLNASVPAAEPVPPRHEAAKTEPSGPIPAGLVGRIQDPVLLASVHTMAALSFGVVFLKLARPDLAGGLAALAVAVVVGVLSARLVSRRGSAPAEAKPFSPVES
jgi:hypothetical protein